MRKSVMEKRVRAILIKIDETDKTEDANNTKQNKIEKTQ